MHRTRPCRNNKRCRHSRWGPVEFSRRQTATLSVDLMYSGSCHSFIFKGNNPRAGGFHRRGTTGERPRSSIVGSNFRALQAPRRTCATPRVLPRQHRPASCRRLAPSSAPPCTVCGIRASCTWAASAPPPASCRSHQRKTPCCGRQVGHPLAGAIAWGAAALACARYAHAPTAGP